MKCFCLFISFFSGNQLQGEYFTVIANCDLGQGDPVVIGSRRGTNQGYQRNVKGGDVIASFRGFKKDELWT